MALSIRILPAPVPKPERIGAFIRLWNGSYPWTVYLGSLAGCVGGVAALWCLLTGRIEVISFAPILAMGIATAYFWGNAWEAWYSSLLTGSTFSSKTIYM